MVELTVFALFSWAVIELIRRTALQAWREYQRERFGQTEREYMTYLDSLRGRE